MLETTCLPTLTWETWDLKGSWISKSLGIATRKQKPPPRSEANHCWSCKRRRIGPWTLAQVKIWVGNQSACPSQCQGTPRSRFVKLMCHHGRPWNFELQELNTTQQPFLSRDKTLLGSGRSWSPSPVFMLSSCFWLLQGLEPYPLPCPPISATACYCKPPPVIYSKMSTFLLHKEKIPTVLFPSSAAL